MVWSSTKPLLGIGSTKGNLVIYDHETRLKVPIVGKHTKKITDGCWNKSNTILGLTSDDKVVSLSNQEGETILEVPIRGEASKLKFINFSGDGGRTNLISSQGTSSSENCLCVLISSKSFMFVPTSGDQVTQLNVTEDRGLGAVLDYHSVKSGLLIGFQSGNFLVISLASATFGQELHAFNSGSRGNMSSFTFCALSQKLAVCSENIIRIFDLSKDLTGQDIDEVIKIEDEMTLGMVEYTDDGQMMAVNSNSSGSIRAFLVQMSIIGAAFESKVAYLTSLTEVTVSDIIEGAEEVNAVIRIETEPSMIAVGPFHVAAAMNNKAWFYSISDGSLIRSYEYVGIVTNLVINGDHAAALFSDGRVNLHVIDLTENIGHNEENRESKIIEEKGMKNVKITNILITSDFLIHSSTSGTIEHFFLEDWSTVNVYRHGHGIKSLACDLDGIHVTFIDDQDNVFIYDSISDSVIDVQVNDWTPKTIFWDNVTDGEDMTPSGVFAIIDEGFKIHTFNYVKETIEGPKVNYVSSMDINKSYHPLLLLDGILTSQTSSGKLNSFTISSHDYLSNYNQKEELIKKSLQNSLKLTRYKDSIEICRRLENSNKFDVSETELTKCYNLIAKCAMYNFRLDIANEMYKRVENVGMIFSLSSVESIEEKNLLSGNIAMFLENYDLAQDLFLQSTKPEEALKMRQCLQDWEASLVLATRLAPKQVPFICRERAVKLELFSNEFHDALDHYERALIGVSGGRKSSFGNKDNSTVVSEGMSGKIKVHNEQCYAGIARNSIRTGNTRRGLEIVSKLKDKELQLECAEILESMKLFNDAANLYEVGGNVEKAASLYIKIKNIDKVTSLIDTIKTKSTLIEYAKVQENDHRFREAVLGN